MEKTTNEGFEQDPASYDEGTIEDEVVKDTMTDEGPKSDTLSVISFDSDFEEFYSRDADSDDDNDDRSKDVGTHGILEEIVDANQSQAEEDDNVISDTEVDPMEDPSVQSTTQEEVYELRSQVRLLLKTVQTLQQEHQQFRTTIQRLEEEQRRTWWDRFSNWVGGWNETSWLKDIFPFFLSSWWLISMQLCNFDRYHWYYRGDFLTSILTCLVYIVMRAAFYILWNHVRANRHPPTMRPRDSTNPPKLFEIPVDYGVLLAWYLLSESEWSLVVLWGSIISMGVPTGLLAAQQIGDLQFALENKFPVALPPPSRRSDQGSIAKVFQWHQRYQQSINDRLWNRSSKLFYGMRLARVYLPLFHLLVNPRTLPPTPILVLDLCNILGLLMDWIGLVRSLNRIASNNTGRSRKYKHSGFSSPKRRQSRTTTIQSRRCQCTNRQAEGQAFHHKKE